MDAGVVRALLTSGATGGLLVSALQLREQGIEGERCQVICQCEYKSILSEGLAAHLEGSCRRARTAMGAGVVQLRGGCTQARGIGRDLKILPVLNLQICPAWPGSM